MSSWLVWAMLGIYPEVPGVPGFIVGSPVFPQVDLKLPGQKNFRLTARAVAPLSFYVQDAPLNGRVLPGPWLPFAAMKGGGELTLDLAASPSTSWGAAPANRPQALMP